MMPFALFEQAAKAIPYASKHHVILHALVRWLRPKSVVEVGSHIGACAVWLARALQENGDGGTLTCIDNFCWKEHKQLEQWEQSMRECGIGWCKSPGKYLAPTFAEFNVQLIVGRSQEVQWPEKVDFAYIDGNHTYPVAKADTLKAISLGATTICMHDTVVWEGSRRWADEFRDTAASHLTHGWDILEENSECGLMIAKRREPKGPCQGADADEAWDKP